MARTVVITGGTGSFGQEMVRHLLATTDDHIRVFSRDEQKQDRMRAALSDPRVRFLLGDVRDVERVRRALRGADVVYHAAALKIIPAGEYNPDEVIKTNVMGSHNVIEAAIDAGVAHMCCVSSDKAVSAVNLYGSSKACMEKLAVLANGYSGRTVIDVVRYGNVIGSRGSILTILKNQAARGALRITHANMTRFWITLPEAVAYVARVAREGNGGIYIPKMRSCKVLDLCRELYPTTKIVFDGMRNGEKMHERLSNEHEVLMDLGWTWRVDGNQWVEHGTPISSDGPECLISAREMFHVADFAREAERAAAE